MTTTMLDALSDEASAIAERSKEGLLILQEVLTRSAALSLQIDTLVHGGEKLVGGDAEMINSFATVEEFAAFQARHFPYQALSPKASPGILPAAQDDGQGNQGSTEVSPGGRESTIVGEVEQVVAEEIPEERATPRLDPGILPDPTPKDQFLDLWATTLLGAYEIAKRIGIPQSSSHNYLVQARRDMDKRAAQGDTRRANEVHKKKQLEDELRKDQPTDPASALVEFDEDRHIPPGKLVHIDKGDRVITAGGVSITVPRYDVAILLRLQDGMPVELEPMMQAAGVMTIRALDKLIQSLAARMAPIGMDINKTDGPLYTLVTR